MSSEKKVIAFIVEGPSDEAAIGSIMKEFFLKNEVQFSIRISIYNAAGLCFG